MVRRPTLPCPSSSAGSTAPRLASVRATSIDGASGRVAPIGPTGAFTVDLVPGSWLVSGLVIDGTGTHEAEARFVQVGCSAATPLVLTASMRSTAPSVPPSLAQPADPLSAVPPLSSRGSLVAASSSSCPAVDTFTVPLVYLISPAAARGNLVTPVLAKQLVQVAAHGVGLGGPGSVGVVTSAEFQAALTNTTNIQALGEIGPSIPELAMALNSDVAMTLYFDRRSDAEFYMVLRLTDAADVSLRSIQRSATENSSLDTLGQMVRDFKAGPPPLISVVKDHYEYPLKPDVTILSTFGSVTPSSQQDVRVSVKDCNGAVYAGRTVYLERSPVPFPAEVSALTDSNGEAHFTVLLGVADREETIEARYERRNRFVFRSDRHTYAIQRTQTGQLQFPGVAPLIRPGGSVSLEITSRDPVTGDPQPLRRIAVQANLGGTPESAEGTTDSAGVVGVNIVAGGTAGLGKVDAVDSTVTPPPPEAGRASEYLVVSSPAALNLNAPVTTLPAGLPAKVTGTLHLDGIPMSGATVALSETGGGTLSSSTATVDDTGGFEITFSTPTDRSGSATVTASLEVEGQTLTRDVPVSWAKAPPPDRLILAYTPGYFLKVFKMEPTGATELFRFAAMTGEIQNNYNSLYLRNQNRMVVHIGHGWGLVDPAGVVEMTYTSDPGFYEVPAAVGTSGKFRVHTFDQVICPPGGESACDLIQKLRLYENATNTLVDEFAVLANGHRYGGLAVGPAGEVLYFDLSQDFPSPAPDSWYLRPADGGPTRMLGTFPGHAAFSPAGDKAYFQVPYVTGDIDEVDLATGAIRRLSPSLGSPVDFSIEPGALLYWYWTSVTDRELIRLDLATGQETAIGPMGPELDVASLIP